MPLATLQEAVTTMSSPPYTIARWNCPADSTSLIELSLPAVYHTEESYRTEPRTISTAKAYAIKLAVFNISCDSTSFDISILTKTGNNNVDTIYEVMKYTDINKSHIDQSFTEFIIRNCDVPLSNKLYIVLTDNDIASPPGILHIQLTYITLQDRVFENVLTS